LATSDTPRAHEILASFRLRLEPSILVTVAVAYEGLNALDVPVVVALTRAMRGRHAIANRGRHGEAG
jgi:hypothetical protein